MEFVFELTGLGWGRVELNSRDWALAHDFSYVTDGPRNLLLVLIRLLEGSGGETCLWDSEPGVFQYIFQVEVNSLELRIKYFSEGFDREGAVSEFECVLQESFFEMVNAFVAGLRGALDTYGLENYKNKWRLYDFPLEELVQTETLLGLR